MYQLCKKIQHLYNFVPQIVPLFRKIVQCYNLYNLKKKIVQPLQSEQKHCTTYQKSCVKGSAKPFVLYFTRFWFNMIIIYIQLYNLAKPSKYIVQHFCKYFKYFKTGCTRCAIVATLYKLNNFVVHNWNCLACTAPVSPSWQSLASAKWGMNNFGNYTDYTCVILFPAFSSLFSCSGAEIVSRMFGLDSVCFIKISSRVWSLVLFNCGNACSVYIKLRNSKIDFWWNWLLFCTNSEIWNMLLEFNCCFWFQNGVEWCW